MDSRRRGTRAGRRGSRVRGRNGVRRAKSSRLASPREFSCFLSSRLLVEPRLSAAIGSEGWENARRRKSRVCLLLCSGSPREAGAMGFYVNRKKSQDTLYDWYSSNCGDRAFTVYQRRYTAPSTHVSQVSQVTRFRLLAIARAARAVDRSAASKRNSEFPLRGSPTPRDVTR